MTDLEKTVDLYKGFGIKVDPVTTSDGFATYVSLHVDDFVSEGLVTGYNGFYTSLEFDKAGKFVQQSIYE